MFILRLKDYEVEAYIGSTGRTARVDFMDRPNRNWVGLYVRMGDDGLPVATAYHVLDNSPPLQLHRKEVVDEEGFTHYVFSLREDSEPILQVGVDEGEVYRVEVLVTLRRLCNEIYSVLPLHEWHEIFGKEET